MKTHFLVLAASLVLASTASAQTTVTNPWVRATVPQQTASGAFLQLRSADAARLVAVNSPLAASVQLHKMEMNGQRMTMREVDGIDLPAGATVNLASGGYHVMLSGLKRQLREGDVVPLSLVIERKKGGRETIAVNAPVKPLTYAGAAGTSAAPPMHH
jgi:copper(I)-binding protein